MATTAEVHGFGARAPYAQPRASEYDMKERVRLSGLFPRVRNQPMSTQLQVLLKEFEKNAALTGILERRRRLEERMQFELKGREGMDALNTNLAPPFRAGLANAATSADVADRLARSRVAGQLAAAVAANAPAAQDAADVMTGAAPKAAARVRIRAPPKGGAKATAPGCECRWRVARRRQLWKRWPRRPRFGCWICRTTTAAKGDCKSRQSAARKGACKSAGHSAFPIHFPPKGLGKWGDRRHRARRADAKRTTSSSPTSYSVGRQ